MMKSRRFFASSAFLLGLCPVIGAAGDSKDVIHPTTDSESRWEVHGGFGIRQSFDLRVASASRDLSGGLFVRRSGAAGVLDSVGPADAEADRSYDDGFVNIGSNYNLTTQWGYESDAQVQKSSQPWDPSQPWDSPGNSSLYLSRTGEAGSDAFQNTGETGEQMFPYLEIHRLWKSDPDSFWHEKGIAAFWSWIPTSSGLAEQLGMLQTRVTDEYHLYGVIPPAAPYSGPALPPGPLLDNIPQDRVEDTSAAGLTGTSFTDLDLDLQTVSVGGIWRHKPHKDLLIDGRQRLYGIDAQAGISLNYARLEMDSHTTVQDGGRVIGRYRDRASESKLLTGIYTSLGATLDIGDAGNWMVITQARYDLAGEIEVRTGATSAEVELNGFSWTIGVGKEW
jgi:hypothetical protein